MAREIEERLTQAAYWKREADSAGGMLADVWRALEECPAGWNEEEIQTNPGGCIRALDQVCTLYVRTLFNYEGRLQDALARLEEVGSARALITEAMGLIAGYQEGSGHTSELQEAALALSNALARLDGDEDSGEAAKALRAPREYEEANNEGMRE